MPSNWLHRLHCPPLEAQTSWVHGEPTSRPLRVGWISVTLLCGVIALLGWPRLENFLTEGLLLQAQRNTEGYFFAALAIAFLPAWGRPPIRLGRAGLTALALLFVLFELVASQTDLPIWVITLNESILGAVVLFAYLLADGRKGRPKTLFYTGMALVILAGELPIPAWGGSGAAQWIVDHAESWGFAVLAALYLDFVRPWPFEARRMAAAGTRVAWYATLVMAPLVLSALNQHGVDSAAAVGPIESSLVWVQRITEAFVATIVLSLHYALVARLGGTADRRDSPPEG